MLQKKEKTQDYFLFWSGFQSKKEDQSKKRQLNKGHNLVKKLKKKVKVEIEEDSVQGNSVTQRDENVENEQQNNVKEDEISKGQMQDLEHVEDSLHEEVNQEVNESFIEQEQVPMGVQSEDKESPLFDEARADTEQYLHEQYEEGVMSRGIKRKVVQLASIKHQGKTLSMLGEIGAGWRTKTRPKNKLRLNMKNLLNPKLNQKKITVIEDSSSQEEQKKMNI